MPDNEPTEPTLRKFFAHSLELLCVARGGQLRTVNPAWPETVGWPEAELTSRPYISFVHPDDRDETEEHLRGLSTPNVRINYQARFQRLDGSYCNLSWSCFSDGEQVYGVAHDVTEFVEARIAAETNAAVARGILRTAVDPIIVIDASGTIIEANDATSELFGIDIDSLLGQNVSVLMPEPYRSEHDSYLERYLAGGEPRIIGIGREVLAQRFDGSTFPMALAVSEVDTGEDRLFTGIIHDLTERNRQRDELRRSNEELEERVADRTRELESLLDDLGRSNRDLEQFAYIASHDLQAPLRNVRQGLEMFDQHLAETIGDSFDDEARELRVLVVNAVLRMETLIKGLLAYSQVQRSGPDGDAVYLPRVVEDVLAGLALDLDEARATVTVGDLPTVRGNPTQLHQVFQNLVQNAIRYRSTDTPLVLDMTSTYTEGGDHVIAVRDNGIGVEPAHHERIFELFRRGHPGYDGVGLGLAICQRIVERHGGRVWVESTAGDGATFFLILPSV